MKAIDELHFRLRSAINTGGINNKIADISTSHTASCHQITANAWFAAFVYAKALNDDNALKYSHRADEYFNKAYDIHPPGQLYHLTQLYFNAVLRGDDNRKDLAKHIAIMAYDNNQKELMTVMDVVAALLTVDQSVKDFLPKLANEEKHKSDLVPLGSVEAVQAIIEGDEQRLVRSLDGLLTIHAKRAGNLRSYICRVASALICGMAILLCDAAQQRGMDVRDKLTKRRQKMNLRLFSPADFPDVDRTIKFPIEVDFLTGEVFLK
ncbi:hypothetical protein [Salinimonas sediminis]|uniref:Uncharacterized protein n=1 Tax=Salinimonas sediminis TaxID=2303538 RepID=A0A346NS15_9ALTE|nr:hypothetical protein [Salinimonas sediminis]AXR08322.1 hypothetical protein D0Y50_19385 [Salinimonas sediminis]